MCKKTVICSALIWFSITIGAQNMHLTYYTENTGLPTNEIKHVVQDSFGFLWIASDAGIIRFDGRDFTDFSRHIPSKYCRYLLPVSEGILVSHDAGISLIEPGLDSSRIKLLQEASIDPDNGSLYYPDRIFQRQNGEIWISQPGGKISRLREGALIPYASELYDLNVPERIVFFCESSKGQFWLCSNDGTLFYFNESEEKLIKKEKFPFAHGMDIHGDEIWIAGNGLSKIRLSEDHSQIQVQKSYARNAGDVTAISIAPDGNVFFGIKGEGLHYLERKERASARTIKIYSNNDPHSVNDLPFKNINQIVMKSIDNIWICSSEGLGVLHRRFFESLSSIPNANTSAITQAENGKIFVNFGDIYAIDKTDFGYQGKILQNFNKGSVTALTPAGNDIWVGTSTGQLYLLGQNGRHKNSIDLTDLGEGIFFMTYDSKNRLWVCQAPEERPIEGVSCILPNGVLIEYGYNHGLLNRITCLRETKNGRIYAAGIGAGSYLYRYLPEDDVFINLSLPLDFYISPNFQIHDLTIDEQGAVWLASTNGLLKYDMERVQKVDIDPSLRDLEIRAVTHMPDSSIWVAFETEGVLRYKDGQSLILKEESGLPSKVMSYRCLLKDNDSRLWIGSAEGVVYSLDQSPKPKQSEKPMVTSLWVDDKKRSANDVSIFEDQTLVINMVSPSFHGFRTFYQYQINDEDWSPLATDREFTFSDLKSGSHSIKFRSLNEGGYLWSDTEMINFDVRKHWYERWFMKWLLAGVALLALFGIFFSGNRKYKKNIAILGRELKKEKEKDAKLEADLAKLEEEHIHSRAHMLSLQILHRMVSKITPGMKWDTVLEIISTDLFKLPGVVAFEIGSSQEMDIIIEGFSVKSNGFITSRIPIDKGGGLMAYCIQNAKPYIFNTLSENSEHILSKPDRRIEEYKSALCVPFYYRNKKAVLFIYGDEKQLFDNFSLKTMGVFATYLEQIT